MNEKFREQIENATKHYALLLEEQKKADDEAAAAAAAEQAEIDAEMAPYIVKSI